MNLVLTRPLCFFDLETTGLSIAKDRIVEICIVKLFPEGHETSSTWKVNPEIAIPVEASDVHGIKDSDVAMSPTFKDIAPYIIEILKGSDIAGHNSNRYDVPLLVEELMRNKIKFDFSDVKFIDTQIIYHHNFRRRLSDAHLYYTGKYLENAHSAKADVDATKAVLLGQIDRHSDQNLGNTVESIVNYQNVAKPNQNIDYAGCFVYNDKGEAVFTFGKYKDKPLLKALRGDSSYYNWMMNSDFTRNTKKVLTDYYTQANSAAIKADAELNAAVDETVKRLISDKL